MRGLSEGTSRQVYRPPSPVHRIWWTEDGGPCTGYCTVTSVVVVAVRPALSRIVTRASSYRTIEYRCVVVGDAPTTSGVVSPNVKRYSTIGDGPRVDPLASRKKFVPVLPVPGDTVSLAVRTSFPPGMLMGTFCVVVPCSPTSSVTVSVTV